MLLGAVTYHILEDMDIEAIIGTLESTGFEAVELRSGHKHGVEPALTAAQRASIKQRFERSKVRLLSLGTLCEFHSADAAQRKHHLDTARLFVELAHDVGAWGIRVRPNGLDPSVPRDTTIRNIAESLRELGDFARGFGVEIWMEVHGPETQNPAVAAAIMRATNHPQVGLCWQSNPSDVVEGSIQAGFELVRPWIRSCHIGELVSGYPYRELFSLMKKTGYDRWTLCEAAANQDPQRILRYYRALWTEWTR